MADRTLRASRGHLIFVGVVAAWCSLALSAQKPDSTTAISEQLKKHIAAIAAGKDSTERAAAITRQLDKLEVPYRRHTFERQNRRGTNIIAELSKNHNKTLLLGAHYDRVATGQGAVDNAASCAMLVHLIERFRDAPLKHYNVDVAFFDLEEGGLIGSQALVEATQGGDEYKLPNAMINFDIFAYGDTLWVMSAMEQAPLAQAARQAAHELEFPLRVTAQYPPSDHLSFIRAKVPTIAISLIDGAEIDGVIALIRGAKPQDRPRIFQIIHSPNDTIEKVDTLAIEKAIPAVEKLIRQFDERSMPPKD